MKRKIVDIIGTGCTVVSLLALSIGCSSRSSDSSEVDFDASSDASLDASVDGDGPVMDSSGKDSSKPDTIITPPDSKPGEDCPGGCDDGTTCVSGECVPLAKCTTDDGCENDTYCDPEVGCVPWGTPPGKDHDPNCVQFIEPGQFAPTVRCEFTKVPDGDAFPGFLDVQATPLVVNFNKDPKDGPPSMVVTFTEHIASSYNEGKGIIRILRGSDCTQEAVIGGVDMDGDGTIEWISSSTTPALADLDGDGVAEIVAYGGNGRVLAFTRKAGVWSLLWKALDGPGGNVFFDKTHNWGETFSNNWGGISIHDLDDDGKPEIIAEGQVFNSQGILIGGKPEGFKVAHNGSAAVLGNLDDDPDIELTDGSSMWAWSGGKWVKEASFTGNAAAGYVAIADFGPYGAGGATLPEVVVVQGGYVKVFAVDGTEATAAVAVPGGGGGRPTVADFDGDGMVEVGVAGRDFYTVFDIDCTDKPRAEGKCAGKDKPRCDNAEGVGNTCPAGILWSRKTQDHSSQLTGSSVFDFEADGKAEVIYADECFVRVYDGTDGTVVFSQYRSSCTWCENPIVADVDGNFRADLVVPSNFACSSGGTGVACKGLEDELVDPQFAGLRCQEPSDCVSGVCDKGLCRCKATSECCASKDDAKCKEMGFSCHTSPAGIGGDNTCRAAHPHGVQGIRVYSDVNDKWVRSRTIWNQHAYAVTHVNENGTIPKTSEWKKNWLQPELNNFRQNVPGTPNGQAIADPTVGAGKFDGCDVSGAVLKTKACNRGSDGMGAGVKIGFYVGDTRVCQTETKTPLAPGQCEEVSCTWASPPTSEAEAVDVVIKANDDASLTECKSGNNNGIIKGVYCTKIY